MGYILAIESAVGRGSIAVLDRDGVVLASTRDSDVSPSRAEELIGALDSVISAAGIGLGDLALIAVSAGPGSYSGIRIGMATALGLRSALKIPSVSVSVLSSLATMAPNEKGVLCAVTVGKKDVAWQSYSTVRGKSAELGAAELAPLSSFAEKLNLTEGVFVAPSDLLDRLTEHDLSNVSVVDAGTNLADLVGRVAATGMGDPNMSPIYLRNKSHTAAGF